MTTPNAPPTEAALSVAVRLFLRHCRATRAATTAQYYKERLATFERWLDAAGLLAPPDRRRPSQPLNASLYQALRPGTIDRFVEAMRAMTYTNALTATPAKPLSPSTIRKNVAAAKTFAAWCAADGHLDINQLAGYRLPPAPEPEIQPFNDAQVVAMVAATATWTRSRRRNLAITLLLLDTGIRAGELLRLTPDDLDLDAGWVRVWGKGARQRRVAIGPRVIEALEAYQGLERRGTCPELFESEKGGPMTYGGLKRMLERLAARGGVTGRRISPHTFRHTFAVNYLRAGGDERSLRLILGHRTGDSIEAYLRYVFGEQHIKERHTRFSPVERLRLGPGR